MIFYCECGHRHCDCDDIPDTPEQRALIATHNAEMKRKHPNLVEIDSPLEEGSQDD